MNIDKYILVDSENVGYKMPEMIYPHTKIVYFVKDETSKINFKEKIKELYGEVPKLVKIENIGKYEHKTNCMDLCILKYMLKLILKYNDIEIEIISKDNDYNDFIKKTNQMIKESNIKITKKTSINETEEQLYTEKMPVHCYPKEIMAMVNQCQSMKQLKNKLSHSQQKKLRLNNYTDDISGQSCWIEYDFYKNIYYIIKTGSEYDKSYSYEKCQIALQKLIDEIHQEFSVFKTKENYQKAVKLKVHKIMRKAALQGNINKPYLKKIINDQDKYSQVEKMIFK